MVTMTTIQPPSAFSPLLVKNVVKSHPISNASRVHNFQLQGSRLCEMIDLSLLISKTIFLWGWVCQILGRDKWKNRDKIGNCSVSQGFEREFLIYILEW